VISQKLFLQDNVTKTLDKLNVSLLYTLLIVVDVEDRTIQISILSNAIAQLPQVNKVVLEMLLKLLHTVVANESINKMSVVNLAIVFSPTLGCSMGIFTKNNLYAYF
jgi:RalA-binding protein 1